MSDVRGQMRRMGEHAWMQAADPLRRVQRVRLALHTSSGPLAQSLVLEQVSGIDLSSIWQVLLDACQDMALTYGASVVAGAAVGAVGGALAGGVGAVPGAVAGGAVGQQAATVVLNWMGLASLVAHLDEVMPDSLRHYQRGFALAWGPPSVNNRAAMWAGQGGPQADPDAAAQAFAQGHVLVVLALLSAMAAYLSKGKGDKTVLLNEIRQSPRLGPKVAQWVQANEGKLIAQGSFKPKHAEQGRQGASQAQSPSQLRAGAGKGGQPRKDPPAPVPPPPAQPKDCGVKPYKDQKCPKGQQAHHIVPDFALRYGSRAKGAQGTDRIPGMPSLQDGPSICLSGHARTAPSEHNAAHEITDASIHAAGQRTDNGAQGVAPIGEVLDISVDAVSRIKPECKEEITSKVNESFKGVDRSQYARTTQQPPAKGTDAEAALRHGESHQRGRRTRGR